MKIYFASDHAGFEMKNALVEFVKELGFEVEDCGAYKLNPEDDYPEFVKKAAQAVSEATGCSRAIILGSSGQGEDMVAGKFPGVRSAEYYGGNLEIVKLSREHNDANVLSIGARNITPFRIVKIVDMWLNTEFSNEERHKRRLKKIEYYSNKR